MSGQRSFFWNRWKLSFSAIDGDGHRIPEVSAFFDSRDAAEYFGSRMVREVHDYASVTDRSNGHVVWTLERTKGGS